MNTADMFDDSWPHTHGTVDGYDNGCKASICPAGTEYGLSCKIAKSLSRNDFKYQHLVKAGATVPEIAAEFELVGTANAPAAAPKPAKKAKPTPATARGGRSLAKAAADTGAIAEQLIKAAAITPLEQAQQIRDIVGPLRRDDGTLNTTAIAEEATLRQRAGLPAWIAELDAPKDTTEQPGPESTGEPVAAAPTPREIREWARGRGYEVGVKGKIPQHIVDHIHQDLEAARNLAVRLEQELARSEEQRDAERTAHAEALKAMRDDRDLAKERLTRRNGHYVEACAERDRANNALELAIRKWGEERAANEASYAVILEQASTINRLVGTGAGIAVTTTPDGAIERVEVSRTLMDQLKAGADASTVHRTLKSGIVHQLARLGSGKTHTR